MVDNRLGFLTSVQENTLQNNCVTAVGSQFRFLHFFDSQLTQSDVFWIKPAIFLSDLLCLVPIIWFRQHSRLLCDLHRKFQKPKYQQLVIQGSLKTAEDQNDRKKVGRLRLVYREKNPKQNEEGERVLVSPKPE